MRNRTDKILLGFKINIKLGDLTIKFYLHEDSSVLCYTVLLVFNFYFSNNIIVLL